MNEIKGFFDEYAKFVDDVTSEIGKKDELFMERAAEIFPLAGRQLFPHGQCGGRFGRRSGRDRRLVEKAEIP